MMMRSTIDYSYDGSYVGLMTVIFEIYKGKQSPRSITSEGRLTNDLFTQYQFVPTEERQATRVLKALRKKMTTVGMANLFKAYLSEQQGVELQIYQMVRYVFSQKMNVESDFRKPYILLVKQLARKVDREVHRMHAFVRFQKTKDNLFAATIDPDFNVIPLIGTHFEKRYADQKWIIYDVTRQLGLYYDMTDLKTIHLEQAYLTSEKRINRECLSEGEADWEHLWKTYFDATNIKERKNTRLHLQHLPKRYWKFLPEKTF